VTPLLGSINLWNPGHLPLYLILPTAFLLGMVHGITPDEHTWPITFSYSVGSYSSKGGRRAGFLFSSAFTLQRAIASEIAFFALSQFEFAARWGFEVYLLVGAVMVASGLYVLNRGHALHLGRCEHSPEVGQHEGHQHEGHQHTGEGAMASETPLVADIDGPKPLPTYMPLVHGFIAGWGVGAFAFIIYTVLAPSMPNAWIGWVPGALFGLGTMAMQVILGSVFGAWMARRHLSDADKAYVARKMSGRTLTGAGLGFLVVAVFGLAFPGVINSLYVVTPIHIHNLHNLGVGFFLAVIVLFSVAIWSFFKSTSEIKKRHEVIPPPGTLQPPPGTLQPTQTHVCEGQTLTSGNAG